MFNYFGSKKRLAPTYDPPIYDIIIEPFAGAAAYSVYWLLRRSDIEVVLYDTDSLVVDLWARLLAMTPDELWNYPNPVKGERTTDPIYLSTSWSDGSWGAAHKGKDYQVTAWQAESFPEGKRLLADVRSRIDPARISIHHASYETAPDIEAVWFIDPPYQTEGHQYASGNNIDFPKLGGWCRSRQGQVIVCESLGADWLDFIPHRMTTTLSNDQSTEVVWYSHPEPTLLDLIS